MAEAMSEGAIEICLAANGLYFPGMFATAGSIALFANPSLTLSYNLLVSGVKASDLEELSRAVLRLHPNSRFRSFDVDEGEFDALADWKGNKLTYARFLIGRLRPELEHVIYCDVDFLWLADIADLWRMRRADVSILAPRDPEIGRTEEYRVFERYGVRFDESRYFCAGLLLMNLRRMREKDVVRRCMDVLRQDHSCPCRDQTALNLVVADDDKVILPERWMRFTRAIGDGRVAVPVLLHYVSELSWFRPKWSDMLTDAVVLWFRVLAAIRGETVWAAFRRHFSPTKIVIARILFLIMSTPVVSALFRLTLVACGKGIVYRNLLQWARPFKIVSQDGRIVSVFRMNEGDVCRSPVPAFEVSRSGDGGLACGQPENAGDES